MEKLKSYGLAVALCSAALNQFAAADPLFEIGVNKTHFFTGGYTARFDHGSFEVNLGDGGASYLFCDDAPLPDGSPTVVSPNPLFCPLGTTAYIVKADKNGDGILDGAAYFSITGPIPAVYAQPFRPDQISLYASPAKLSLASAHDIGDRIYYNIFDPAHFTQYNVAAYELNTFYAGAPDNSLNGTGTLVQMNKDLPPGSYTFKFPGVKRLESQPDYFVYPTVTVNTFIEAFGLQRYGAGFRFTSGVWDNQYYQMDPRVLTKITWTGNAANVVRPGIDGLKLAILNPGASGDFDEDYLFPIKNSKFYVDAGSVLNTAYNLPPATFRVGDLADLSVQFQRSGLLASTSGAVDVSIRDFRAKLKMVDSYAGYASLRFPQGTSNNKVSATADYDGDGVNNITEYAAEFPTLEQIASVAPDGVVVTGYADDARPPLLDATKKGQLEVSATYLDNQGHMIVDVTKRAFTGTTLTPSFSIGTPNTSGAPVRYTKLTIGAGKAWELVFNPSEDDPSIPDPIQPDPQSDETFDFAQNVKVQGGTQPVTGSVRKSFWRLRSKAVVTDPAAVLPVFKVTVTSKALN